MTEGLYDRLVTTWEHFDMALVVNKIQDTVKLFSVGGYRDRKPLVACWPELCNLLSRSKARYHRAQFGDVEVLTGESAGRVLITIQKGDRQITLIGAADEPNKHCGLQSIHASPNEADELMSTVCKNWDVSAFQPNPEGAII